MSTPVKGTIKGIHLGKEGYGSDADLVGTKSLTRNALREIVTQSKSALKDTHFVLQAVEVK